MYYYFLAQELKTAEGEIFRVLLLYIIVVSEKLCTCTTQTTTRDYNYLHTNILLLRRALGQRNADTV